MYAFTHKVLKNGVEVKLQRNALSVLEPPTGNEVEDDDFDNASSSSDMGDKDNDFSSAIEFSKLSKPRVRHTRPWVSSTSVKPTNRSSYKEVHSDIQTSQLRVNFAKLRTSSLWRYWRNFKLGNANPNITKQQLVNAVQQHFASQQVDEFQVIAEFIHAAKRLKAAATSRESD
ncbi:hypothetical protein ACSBR2_038105 [Camellia fascicularis]